MNLPPYVPPQLNSDDVWALIRCMPSRSMVPINGVRNYITPLVRDGEELADILAQYPSLRYAPLDPHYVLLKLLGGMSEALISDLNPPCGGGCGVQYAAFLVALAPDPVYRKHLLVHYDRLPRCQWLVDLALAEIDGRVWDVDPAFQQLIHRLRAVLARAPLPSTPFRPAFDFQQEQAEREQVRAAYRAGGIEAAIETRARTQVLSKLKRY
ncbi:hypothetical protein F2P45_20640 [Massilia sp. CCM 8733]|uniref:Uncharacterized protein n=1 Tax=Massilia mucilaginosa TaxID=2609282 RepID=A0ABX0NXM1_9BURK|nr:hypothetical protein [Massilia mucilaginosa]NHZ91395.1 hypothetical protein [Massilia mucilaginosa]